MFFGNSRITLGQKKYNFYIGVNTIERIKKLNETSWEILGSGFNTGVVRALLPYKNYLLIGGGMSPTLLVKWNGSSFSEFEGGVTGEVFVITDDTSGNLYVGGNILSAGGVSVNRIAKWDGSSWSTFSSGMGGVTATVYSIYYHNGVIWNRGGLSPTWPTELYAAGAFTTAGGSTANRIARWNGTQWDPLGDGLNNIGRTLMVYKNDLYVGGNFNSPGSRIAKWDGFEWSSIGGIVNGAINSMVIFEDELVIGGSFSTIGGVSFSRVAKWNGNSWSSLGSGLATGTGIYVNKLFVHDKKLYAVGRGLGGTLSDDKVKVWDGSSWSDLGDDPGAETFTITAAR
jgi:hypothetical protein